MSGGTSPRRAAIGDLEAIAAIAEDVLDEPWPARALAEEILRPSAEVLVLENGGSIAGFLIAWSVADEGSILLIAVARAQKRRGIGRRLLEAGERSALRRGVRTMHLEVRAHNTDARAFYRAQGYVEVGVRAGYYGGKEDAIAMSKRFAGDLELVILAGGRASRMGGVLKPALVRPDGETILGGLSRTFLPHVARMLLVAPEDVLAALDPQGRFVHVADPGLGPARALVLAAGIGHAPWLFAVGGDQPNLSAELLFALQAEATDDYDAVAFESDAADIGGRPGPRLEPLGALYRRTALAASTADALQGVLLGPRTKRLDGRPWRQALEDADTPQDAARLGLHGA